MSDLHGMCHDMYTPEHESHSTAVNHPCTTDYRSGKHSTTRWYIFWSTVPITDRRRTNLPQDVRHTVDLMICAYYTLPRKYHVPHAQKKKKKCACRDDRVNACSGRLILVVVQDLLWNKGRSIDCIVKLQGRVTFRIAQRIFHEQ